MTKDELVAKLHDIEWEDFEVKAAKSELPKNIWESVGAFSNTSGGWWKIRRRMTPESKNRIDP